MQPLVKKEVMLYFAIINFQISWWNPSTMPIYLSVQVDAGAGLSTDLSHSRLADILVQDWGRGKPAACDICVVSLLNSIVLSAAGATAGAASEAAELRKHTANNAKCTELGRVSIRLVAGVHPSCGRCPSLLWRVSIPLVAGVHLSCGGCPSILWRVSLPLVAGVHPFCGGCPSLLWRVSIPFVAGVHPSLVAGVHPSLVAGVHPSCGGCPSLLWRVSIPLVVGHGASRLNSMFQTCISPCYPSMATFELYARLERTLGH